MEVIGTGLLVGRRYVDCMFASSIISLYQCDDSVHDNLHANPFTGPGDVYTDTGALGWRSGLYVGDPDAGAAPVYDCIQDWQSAGADGKP